MLFEEILPGLWQLPFMPGQIPCIGKNRFQPMNLQLPSAEPENHVSLLNAVHIGKHDIQNDQFHGVLLKKAQRLQTVAGRKYRVARIGQIVADQIVRRHIVPTTNIPAISPRLLSFLCLLCAPPVRIFLPIPLYPAMMPPFPCRRIPVITASHQKNISRACGESAPFIIPPLALSTIKYFKWSI